MVKGIGVRNMPKKKCVVCNKFFNYEEDVENIKCTNCNAEYVWEYSERGWCFGLKESIVKNCPVCKGTIFLSKEKYGIEVAGYSKKFFSHDCECCKEKLFGIQEGYRIKLVPFFYMETKCEWCDKKIIMDTEQINETYLKVQASILDIEYDEGKAMEFLLKSGAHAKRESCLCRYCHKKSIVSYMPWWGKDIISTGRDLSKGRKKKITEETVTAFLNWLKENPSFQRYGIVHENWIEDYCERENYKYDELYNALENQNLIIFWPRNMNEIDVDLYKEEFAGLKLKENYATEGVASLAGMLAKRKEWKNTREKLLDVRQCACEICGFQTEETRILHAHEEWEIQNEVAILKDIKLICNRCHACMHRNQFILYRVEDGASMLVDGIPRADYIAMHLMWVNKVKAEVVYAYRKKMLKENRERELEYEQKRLVENADVEKKIKYEVSEKVINREELVMALEEKGLLKQGTCEEV